MEKWVCGGLGIPVQRPLKQEEQEEQEEAEVLHHCDILWVFTEREERERESR